MRINSVISSCVNLLITFPLHEVRNKIRNCSIRQLDWLSSCSTEVATLMQCAELCDWKLILYLERKKDKLDSIGELALWRAFNTQASTMTLRLSNMQNRKRKVLTINRFFLIWFYFNNWANNQVWTSCDRFKIRLTPLFQDIQTVNRLSINLLHLRFIKFITVSFK